MTEAKVLMINGVNVYKLQNNALIKVVEQLNDKLTSEVNARSLIQCNHNELNVFWKISKQKFMKLTSDMANLQKTAEESMNKVNDLKKNLRLQNLCFTCKNSQNFEKARQENEEVIRALSVKNKKQINDLLIVNSSLQEIVRNKDLHRVNELKSIQQTYVKRFNDNTKLLQSQMGRFINRIDQMAGIAIQDLRAGHTVELENLKNCHEEDIRETIIKSCEQIETLRKFYWNKGEAETELIKSLTERLKIVVEKNKDLEEHMVSLRENDKKSNSDLTKYQQMCHYFEKHKNDFDICQIRLKNALKHIQKYKSLYKLKCHENDLLETDMKEMEDGFRKYDDYFRNVLLNIQSSMMNENIIKCKTIQNKNA